MVEKLETPDIALVEDNYVLWETFLRDSWLPQAEKARLEQHMLKEWYSYPDMYASYLSKKGWSVVRCVASNGVSEPTVSTHRLGHSVVQIPTRSHKSSGLQQARTFVNQMLRAFKEPPRLVHFNSYYSSYFALFGYRRRESVLTCQYSGGEPPRTGPLVERLRWKLPIQRALGRAGGVLVGKFSEEERRQIGILKEYFGLPEDKIVDFPILAVDRTLFFERNKLESARRLGFDESKFNVLVVSSVPKRPKQGSLAKDPFAVLSIFSELRDTKTWNLHFVGYGPGFRELEAYASQLGVAEMTKFHGIVDHRVLPEYDSASDIVINPYDSLDLKVGTATLEGFACNRPVIMFRRSPSISFEQPGGYLIDRAPKAGARQILSIMGQRDKLRDIARGGQEMVERYDLPRVGERLSEIFRGFLG